MDEFDALIAVAGISPSADDMAALRDAYPAIVRMKARIRQIDVRGVDPAHVFQPVAGPRDESAIYG